jgi:DNA-damage-inducible protein J
MCYTVYTKRKGVIHMAQTVLNVRIDEDVKKALEEFCGDVGMNVSVAVNMFAKAVIREQRLPFAITTISPVYNDVTIAALEESEEIIKSGKRRFKNSAEMLKELKSDVNA